MGQNMEMERLRAAINDPEKATMSLEDIVAEEITQFKKSETYQTMLMAERYYRNRSDVQNKKNEVSNRSNTKIEHPLLKKLVDQKADYLLAKPFTVTTESKAYSVALNEVFGANFRRKLMSLGKGAVKSGIGWLQPYFNGPKLEFMRLPSTEVIPLWADGERSQLDGFIRFYEQIVYMGATKGSRTLAELWTRGGVKRYASQPVAGQAPTSKLKLELDRNFGNESNGYTESHFVLEEVPYNFAEVPLVWLRYNEEELPLAYFVKELIDDINWQTSVTADVLRDIAKFIYVLRNYGGADLAEFVKDLQQHLAIKVDSDGGVDKLQADLNIEAVMAFLDKNRRDVLYFGGGVDTRDPELGNASGSAIQFRYMDLENDCQAMALELQDTFARLKLFVDVYLQATGQGDFTGEEFGVLFNMDMPVNETDVINNVRASEGVISRRTQLENHPWVEDAQAELAQMEKEKQEAMKQFGEGLFADDFGVKAGGEEKTAGRAGEQEEKTGGEG